MSIGKYAPTVQIVRAYIFVELKQRTKDELEIDEKYLAIEVMGYALPRNTGKELYNHLDDYDQAIRLLQLGNRDRLDYGTTDYTLDVVPDSQPMVCGDTFLHEYAPELVHYCYLFTDEAWHVVHKGELYVISGATLEQLAPMEELTRFGTPIDTHFEGMTPIQRKIAEMIMKRKNMKIEDYL